MPGWSSFTLADLALAAVMNSHRQLTLSLESNIMFIHSAIEGDVLTAVATETSNHHKIPYYEVKVYNQDNILVCSFTALAYRKNKEFPFDSLM